VVAMPTAAVTDTCGVYYFKHFATSGSISPRCGDANSWGVNAPNGTGYDATYDIFISNPAPYATNVSLAGRSWDVYLYHWPGGGLTMSYLDRANSGWWSSSLSPFFNHGISNGWYSSNDYLTSIQAGWEFGQGSYTASSWGVAGF
jgi:Glycosyl hydrolase family 12